MAINIAINTTTKTYLECFNVFHDILILQHVRYLHLLDFLEMKFNTTAHHTNTSQWHSQHDIL